MAGRWSIEPEIGHGGGYGRLGARGKSAMPGSRIVVHATMTALVLSITGVVLLLTALATAVSVDGLQETLTDFSWAPLVDLAGDLLYDMFTDAQGAPTF